jgi:hypothetical protein
MGICVRKKSGGMKGESTEKMARALFRSLFNKRAENFNKRAKEDKK